MVFLLVGFVLGLALFMAFKWVMRLLFDILKIVAVLWLLGVPMRMPGGFTSPVSAATAIIPGWQQRIAELYYKVTTEL